MANVGSTLLHGPPSLLMLCAALFLLRPTTALLCSVGEYPSGTRCPSCPHGKYGWTACSSCTKRCSSCPSGKFQNAFRSTSCKICPAGQFQDATNSVSCKICPAGQFQDATTSLSCKICPAGQYAPTSAGNACTVCDTGHYQPQTGQTGCIACTKGKYRDETKAASSAEAIACQICGVGKYTDVAGLASCKGDACAAGRFFAQVAQTSAVTCTACDTGHYQPQTGQTGCIACTKGKYRDETKAASSAEAIACQICGVGKYTDVAGLASCKVCDTGHYQPYMWRTGCIACPKGKFQDERAQVSCKDCAGGKYQDQTGQGNCKGACDAGRFSVLKAQVEAPKCDRCPQGKHSDRAMAKCDDVVIGKTDCAPSNIFVTGENRVCNLSFSNQAMVAENLEIEVQWVDEGRNCSTLHTNDARWLRANVTRDRRQLQVHFSAAHFNDFHDACPDIGRALLYSEAEGVERPSNAAVLTCGVQSPGGNDLCCNTAGVNDTSARIQLCARFPSTNAGGGRNSARGVETGVVPKIVRKQAKLYSFIQQGWENQRGLREAWRSPLGGSRLVLFGTTGQTFGAKGDPCSNATVEFQDGKKLNLTQLNCIFNETDAMLEFNVPAAVQEPGQTGSNISIHVEEMQMQFSYAPAAITEIYPPGQAVDLNNAPIIEIRGYNFGIGESNSAFSCAADCTSKAGIPESNRTHRRLLGAIYALGAQHAVRNVPSIRTAFAERLGEHRRLSAHAEPMAAVFGGALNVQVGGDPCIIDYQRSHNRLIRCQLNVKSAKGGLQVVVRAFGRVATAKEKFQFIPSPCDKGEGLNSSYACIACPKGKFSDVYRTTACQLCPAGQYQDEIGATVCKPVPVGYEQPSSGSYAPRPCRAGTFASEEGMEFCETCASNVSCPGTNTKLLPSGKIAYAATVQHVCSPGHKCIDAQQIACPKGMFRDGRQSADRCLDCPTGTYTEIEGSVSCRKCRHREQCNQGRLFADESGQPLLCALGTKWSDGRCLECASNEFAFHSARYPQWTEQLQGVPDECVRCPYTAQDEATCFGGVLTFNDGFWHSGTKYAAGSKQTVVEHRTPSTLSDTNITFYPCPCKTCCKVHHITGSTTCAKGNMGALCAVCAAQYFKRTENGACVACAEANMRQDVPWVAITTFALFIVLLLATGARAEWVCIRRLQRYVQGCRLQLVGKSKIVLSFFQVIMLSKMVYRVPFPQVFVDFMETLSFLRFELFQLVPLRCVVPFNFHDILNATVVVAMLLILPPWCRVMHEYHLVPHCCAKTFARLRLNAKTKLANPACCTGRLAPSPGSGVLGTARRCVRKVCCGFSWQSLLQCLLVTTYLLYPTLTYLLFQTFSCEEIHLGRYLHYDFAIDCDSAAHVYHEDLATMAIVVFVFGVPVLFWALLFRHRHNLNAEAAHHLRFFFGDYKTEHWYWEVVECFRKLILTGVALFFGGQGSLLQTALSMALVVIYIPVLLRLQPYKLPSDNYMALLVNIEMVFVFFTSLLLKVETSFESTGRFETGYSENTLGYFLIVLAVIVFTLWCVALYRDVRAFNTEQSFRLRHDNTLLTLPRLCPPNELYHVFISHSQQDGGDQVAQIKKELEKYIGTINIFTDVAAGRLEHALTAKSQLYSAIESSTVFLVFLTKTYFTRKWCVKEFQEAVATGKHIVLVLDTDTRHGGMAVNDFVQHSVEQKARCKDDAIAGASNLWNQSKLGSDTECATLCEWVAAHVVQSSDSSGDEQLTIRAFKYELADGDAIAVPERTYPIVPWYRFAEEKKVALQLIAEHMLAAPRWGIAEEDRSLRLPMPHAKLPPTQGHHICLSAFHACSAILRDKLKLFYPSLKIYLRDQGQPFAANDLRQCNCMLVVNCAGASSGGSHASLQLVHDAGYQTDIRTAIEAGLDVIFLHELALSFGTVQSALWDQAGLPKTVLQAEHLIRLFDPIASYCQPSLLSAPAPADIEDLSLFDQSTLAQIVHKVAAATASQLAARWKRACACTCMRRCFLRCKAHLARAEQDHGASSVEECHVLPTLPTKSSIWFGAGESEDRARGWTIFGSSKSVKSMANVLNPMAQSARLARPQQGEAQDNPDSHGHGLAGLQLTVVDETGDGDIAALDFSTIKGPGLSKSEAGTALSMASKSMAKI